MIANQINQNCTERNQGKRNSHFKFNFHLHGCEAWSLILREERRLRVFENRILRDANRKWRMLHNEDLYSLYCSPNIA